MGERNLMKIEPRMWVSIDKMNTFYHRARLQLRENFHEYEIKISLDYFIKKMHLENEFTYEIITKDDQRKVLLIFKDVYIITLNYTEDKWFSDFVLDDIYLILKKYFTYELEIKDDFMEKEDD